MCIRDSNKTLAAQLYGEFKEFFPENAVEYFVSYYDYYQPEAYVPSTDTYIETVSYTHLDVYKRQGKSKKIVVKNKKKKAKYKFTASNKRIKVSASGKVKAVKAVSYTHLTKKRSITLNC